MKSATTAMPTVTGYTPSSATTRIQFQQTCAAAQQYWFGSSDLLRDQKKSDAAFFGTKPGPRMSGLPSSVCVAGCPVAMSLVFKIHGFSLNSLLSFDFHMKAVVRICNCNLLSLHYICHSLTRYIASTVVSVVSLDDASTTAMRYSMEEPTNYR